MPHLLVDISSHGYGHVSQTSAVVNELVRLLPGLRVTIRTTSPYEFLKSRLHWLKQNAACLEVERASLQAGELDQILQQLWAQPLPTRPDANGALETAQYMFEFFSDPLLVGDSSDIFH